jgi:hypothetical protein
MNFGRAGAGLWCGRRGSIRLKAGIYAGAGVAS